MNVKKAAGLLSNMGRGGDTLLAHINPQEAALLKAAGGSGKVNPKTGLLEFDDGGDGGGDGGDGGGDSGGDGGLGGGLGGFGGFGLGGSGGLSGIGSVGGFGNPGFGGVSGFGSSIGNGFGGFGGAGSSGSGFRGYSVGPNGTLSGPAGFDSPGFSLSRSNPANTRSSSGNAMSDALDMNEAMRQAGAITGAEYAANREGIFSGEVGNLSGLLGERLKESYSPRTTGMISMVKNMFSTPEKVDTPYSALNSLISSGYAEPTEEGFRATPKSVLGMFGGLVNPMGVVKGLLTGNPMAAMPGPMSVLGSIPGMVGLANQMQVAGLNTAKAGRPEGQAATGSGPSAPAGGSNGVTGDGGDFKTFDPATQYAEAQTSPLVSGLTIDPYAWFASKRGLLG